MFIFFTCIKKTNQKKVQPITWSRKRDYPALLAKNGRHRDVANAFDRVAYPFFASLLGGVKWPLTTLFLCNPFCDAEHRSC